MGAAGARHKRAQDALERLRVHMDAALSTYERECRAYAADAAAEEETKQTHAAMKKLAMSLVDGKVRAGGAPRFPCRGGLTARAARR